MRKAKIYSQGKLAGFLIEVEKNKAYRFEYIIGYNDFPVSLTMPTSLNNYSFRSFPPFFEGLLPEGIMLEGLLKQRKIDKNDYFAQLIATGKDLVGAITVELVEHE